jgi:hypothetical protein
MASADKLLGFDTKRRVPVSFTSPLRSPDEVFNSSIVCSKGRCYITAQPNLLLEFNSTPVAKPLKQLLLECVTVNGRNFHHPPDTMYFDHDHNTLNVRFCTLDFEDGNSARFRYSIDGVEAADHLSPVQPVFLYNLAPGWHELQIAPMYKGTNYVPAKLHVFIRPPFWQRGWFYLLVTLVVLSITVLSLRFFIAREKRRSQLVLQLKEFELKALHAQMNPHFIFNCLNGIKALMLSSRQDEASHYLSNFSRLIRLTLDHSRKTFISLKENFDYIDLYLQSEKIRFPDLSYTIHVDENVNEHEVLIVPLLLQPIVENAIWHGLQKSAGSRFLRVSCSCEGEGYRLEVEDNGVGIDHTLREKKDTSQESIGLQNIRERIQLVNQKYKLNYRIDFMDKSALQPGTTGTRVILYFNSLTHHDHRYYSR